MWTRPEVTPFCASNLVTWCNFDEQVFDCAEKKFRVDFDQLTPCYEADCCHNKFLRNLSITHQELIKDKVLPRFKNSGKH